MGGDELITAGVINGALDPAMHPADRQLVGLVEVAVGLLVLELAVLDNDTWVGSVRIDR